MADSWLERELSRQFAPVSAPESLWRQIHEQRRPLRVRSYRWAEWSFATLAIVVLGGSAFWQFGFGRAPRMDLEKLAAQELRGLSDGSGQMDFCSSEPREIQAWVKAKSNIDVPLPKHTAPGSETVRLLGARMIRVQGVSVAAVTYRIGDDLAALLVTGRHTVFGGERHVFSRVKFPVNGAAEARIFAWNMGREDYAIAFAGSKDPQRACLLCHADPPGLVAFN